MRPLIQNKAQQRQFLQGPLQTAFDLHPLGTLFTHTHCVLFVSRQGLSTLLMTVVSCTWVSFLASLSYNPQREISKQKIKLEKKKAKSPAQIAATDGFYATLLACVSGHMCWPLCMLSFSVWVYSIGELEGQRQYSKCVEPAEALASQWCLKMRVDSSQFNSYCCPRHILHVG